MKKILVTGCSGYIGQHLCKLLHDSGYEVWGLDYVWPTDPRHLHEFIYFDVRNTEHFQIAYMGEYDSIIHLAALVQVGESVKFPTKYYETNINGTINLLRYVKHENFIFASTGAASSPNSPYGYSKFAAEQIVREISQKHTIFRFYNVTGSEGYSATNPDGLFYNLVKAQETGTFHLYGTDYDTKDGTCVREYVHVMDICRALMSAIENPTNDTENLAYGDTRTVKEIIKIFKEVNKCDFEVIYKDARPGDLEAMYLPNPSKLMTRNYTYEEMLKWKH